MKKWTIETQLSKEKYVALERLAVEMRTTPEWISEKMIELVLDKADLLRAEMARLNQMDPV